MTAQAILFTLACLGISETVYLVRKRINYQEPFCPIGENCVLVLRSPYNKIFFVHNDVLGLIFYIASALLTATLVIIPMPPLWWVKLFKILVAAGSFASIFFTYLQFRVIKAWCFWCLMSALTIWLMAVIIILSNF